MQHNPAFRQKPCILACSTGYILCKHDLSICCIAFRHMPMRREGMPEAAVHKHCNLLPREGCVYHFSTELHLVSEPILGAIPGPLPFYFILDISLALSLLSIENLLMLDEILEHVCCTAKFEGSKNTGNMVPNRRRKKGIITAHSNSQGYIVIQLRLNKVFRDFYLIYNKNIEEIVY